MQMVHIEDRYISEDGTIDLASAVKDANGLAILGIFFYVDPKKPQVYNQLNFIVDISDSVSTLLERDEWINIL